MVAVSEISVSADSGWREVNDGRVKELKDHFRSGMYGIGLLRRPSIVQAHGSLKKGADGNFLLLDGKHTIVALGQLKAEYDEATAGHGGDDDVATAAVTDVGWSAVLIQALTVGVCVDVVEFDDDDEDLRVAYCAQLHDEAVNKFRPTSLLSMVQVAERYRKKAPGGAWDHVRKTLIQIYGHGRRTFVTNMLVAAQTLPEELLRKLEDSGVPNSYIYDNKYFSGYGSDSGKRVSLEGRIAILSMYSEEVTKGTAVNKKVPKRPHASHRVNQVPSYLNSSFFIPSPSSESPPGRQPTTLTHDRNTLD